jgi:hypothetical protein
MSLRYEGVGVFFIGVLVVLASLLGGRFPAGSKMAYPAMVGLVFYTVLQSQRVSLRYLNQLRIDRDSDTDYPSYKEHYLGGGVIAYLSILLAALSAPGTPGGRPALKLLLALKTTALVVVALFLIGTSSTSTAVPDPDTLGLAATSDSRIRYALYSANLDVMAIVFLVWLFAVTASLTGSRELAGASGVVFGCQSFFLLQQLLAVDDFMSDSAASTQSHQTRAGYIIAWIAGFFAFLVALPVYSQTPKVRGWGLSAHFLYH